MKKIFRIFILGLICVSFLSAQKINVYSRPKHSERSHNYDVLHYLIRINLDIKNKSFSGQTTITIAPLQDDFVLCALDAEDYTITSVVDTWGKALRFEQKDKSIIVHLDKPYAYGETVSFTVSYQGQNPKAGLRFYEKSKDRPALVASDSWPDHVHHWVPCYDFPNDKATEEVIATVKAGLKVASNGRLAGVVTNKMQKTTTWHWIQDRPHSTYLFFLAAAPYAVIHDSLGTVPINYWVYPGQKSFARISFKDTPRMMDFFNRTFGYPYPWAKYDQVVVPFGGGMESTSCTAMGQRIIHDDKAEKDFSNIGIVSHELGHQWWGDLITLRTWAHTWLNESFGTYCDYLYTRYDRGPDEGAVNLLGKKNSYLREAHTRYIRPIVFDHYNRPQDVFDAHTYPKGAAVLHMLRSVLGDKNFFRTLKYFLHTYAFEPVDTHDFMKAVLMVTGRNLDWFFDEWLFKPGHPVFDIHSEWNAASKTVLIKIRQVQDISKGVPVFQMPVRLGITTSQGRKTHEVMLRKKDETFSFPAPQKPLLVRFDEGNVLLKEWTFPKSLEELVYQLKNDDVIGRMWAANELLRFRDEPAAVESLMESGRKDPFWAVRRDAVQTLGKIHKETWTSFFKDKCLDTHSRVRAAALAELAKYKNSAFASFFRTRFLQEDSYLAQAEAVRALGKCADSGAVPFLKKALKMSSPRNIIQRAAQQAIKELENR